MKVKAAFLFIAPETAPELHNSVIETPVLQLRTVGVSNYEQAVQVAGKLAEDGVKCIELCAGFGNEGVAAVSNAVKGKAAVGVVRFDNHPGFDFKSGDNLFK